MTFSVLTIFPDMVRQAVGYGVLGRAIKQGLVDVEAIDLRDFTTDKHRSVDDKPFGGGPGMVMRVDVVDRALQGIRDKEYGISGKEQKEARRERIRIILLSASGSVFSQVKASELSALDHVVLISGRYEGIDERVRQHLVDEELSIGEYVLSGGELPALVVIDAVARLVPGVIGDPESLVSESFSQVGNKQQATSNKRETRYDFPQYTQPAEYRGWKVPEVLRSGNHAAIERWRQEQILKQP